MNTKQSYIKNEDSDKVILNTLDSIKSWVNNKYKEQKEECKLTGQKPYIDFSDSKLSYLCFHDKEIQTMDFFNFIDLSGQIDGILNIEGEYGQYKVIVSRDIKLNRTIIGNGIFQHVIFKGKVEINDTVFFGTCNFKNCIFEDTFSTINTVFEKNIELENCTFKGKVIMRSSQINVEYSHITTCIFKKGLDLNNAIFKQLSPKKPTFEINNCDITESFSLNKTVCKNVRIRVNNNIFNDGISLKDPQWETKAFFIHDCVIKGTSQITYGDTNTSNIITLGLWANKIYGDIHIENLNANCLICNFCHVYSSALIRIDELKSENVKFEQNTIEGRVNFAECTIRKANFEHTISIGLIDCLGTKIVNLSNEFSAMLLKNECKKLGIDSLASYYYIMQMELRRKSNDIKMRDKLLLLFKEKSNYFSTNWLKPIYAILIIPIITLHITNWANGYNIFTYNGFDLEALDKAIKCYLSIINVFNITQNGLNVLDTVNINSFGVICVFITKILISILVYQTIQVFKKNDNI